MRLAVFVVLVVATFVANSAMGLASAEDTTTVSSSSNNNKRIAVDKFVKRLRASQKVGGEERGGGGPVSALKYAAARFKKGDSKVQSTQGIVKAVKNHERMPKWAVAVVVLLGLGIVTGAVVGGIKGSQL